MAGMGASGTVITSIDQASTVGDIQSILKNLVAKMAIPNEVPTSRDMEPEPIEVPTSRATKAEM